MYKSFKISSAEINFLISSYSVVEIKKTIFDKLYESVDNCASSEKIKRAYINGTKLEQDWFPQLDGKFQVFISHSHRDINDVSKFALWMEQYLGINCFIDSVYWKYADKLLLELDKTWCRVYDEKSSQYLYSYDKRNVMTSNVHCMLSMALMKMIDACECVLFIDSENSIKCDVNDNIEKTPSPWIYEELEMIQHLRRVKPVRKLALYEGRETRFFSSLEKATLPNICYDVPIKNMQIVMAQKLNEIARIFKKNDIIPQWETSLDMIYNVLPEI